MQLSPHWGNILRVFDQLLETLKRNNVPSFLVRSVSTPNRQVHHTIMRCCEVCRYTWDGCFVDAGDSVSMWATNNMLCVVGGR